MENFIIKPSLKRSFFIIIICIIFILLSIYIGFIGTPEAIRIKYSFINLGELGPTGIKFIFGFITLFFGYLLIEFLKSLFKNIPLAVISDKGIEIPQLKTGVMAWDKIKKVSVISMSGQQFAILEVTNEAEIMARAHFIKRLLSKLNKMMGAHPISFPLCLPKAEKAKLLDFIAKKLS